MSQPPPARLRATNIWDFREKKFWKPGAIVCAPDHTGCNVQPNTPQSEQTVITPIVHPMQYYAHLGCVVSKRRKFVILGVQTQHVIALPIRTRNATGLNSVPEEQRQNFCAIRDFDDQNNPKFQENLSKHDMIYVRGNRNRARKDEKPVWGNFGSMSKSAYVHLNFAVYIHIKQFVEFFGEVAEEDLTRLRELFIKYLWDPFGGESHVGVLNNTSFPALGGIPEESRKESETKTAENSAASKQPTRSRTPSNKGSPSSNKSSVKKSSGKKSSGKKKKFVPLDIRPDAPPDQDRHGGNASMLQVRFSAMDSNEEELFGDDSGFADPELNESEFEDQEIEFIGLEDSEFDDPEFNELELGTEDSVHYPQLHGVIGSRVAKGAGRKGGKRLSSRQ